MNSWNISATFPAKSSGKHHLIHPVHGLHSSCYCTSVEILGAQDPSWYFPFGRVFPLWPVHRFRCSIWICRSFREECEHNTSGQSYELMHLADASSIGRDTNRPGTTQRNPSRQVPLLFFSSSLCCGFKYQATRLSTTDPMGGPWETTQHLVRNLVAVATLPSAQVCSHYFGRNSQPWSLRTCSPWSFQRARGADLFVWHSLIGLILRFMYLLFPYYDIL